MFPGLLLVVVGVLAADEDPVPPPTRVGQIVIVGNEVTPQTVILDRIPLYPGGILTLPDLRASNRKLAHPNLLGIGATVEVLGADGKGEHKDIVVKVRETPVLTRLLVITKVGPAVVNAVPPDVPLISYLLFGLPDTLVSRLTGR